jgi:hypothetical protein
MVWRNAPITTHCRENAPTQYRMECARGVNVLGLRPRARTLLVWEQRKNADTHGTLEASCGGQVTCHTPHSMYGKILPPVAVAFGIQLLTYFGHSQLGSDGHSGGAALYVPVQSHCSHPWTRTCVSRVVLGDPGPATVLSVHVPPPQPVESVKATHPAVALHLASHSTTDPTCATFMLQPGEPGGHTTSVWL